MERHRRLAHVADLVDRATAMSTPREYLHRIGQIVGDDITDGELNLNLTWKNHVEAKVLLTRIRTIQKELRLLKKDVSATISAVKSEFTTARTSVGTSLVSGLAAGFFGRRTVGRFNSAQRDDLRRSQISTVEPYDRVKRVIEQILSELDSVKGRIELSPEYQRRTPPAVVAKPPTLVGPLTRRFFVFLAEEVKGPYTLEQLQALRDASAITDDTPCCPDGAQEWKSYAQVMP